MTIWFSSDHHFHHHNIIAYGQRPFKDIEEMNEALVARHNSRVRPSDHWYCLGDVTMLRDNQGRGLRILDRMNGHKRLILGNHDHYAMKHYLRYFEKVMGMNRMDDLWFTHVPVHPLSLGSCRANVHGHTHQKPDYDSKYFNISVERTDYYPLSLEQLKSKLMEEKSCV